VLTVQRAFVKGTERHKKKRISDENEKKLKKKKKKKKKKRQNMETNEDKATGGVVSGAMAAAASFMTSFNSSEDSLLDQTYDTFLVASGLSNLFRDDNETNADDNDDEVDEPTSNAATATRNDDHGNTHSALGWMMMRESGLMNAVVRDNERQATAARETMDM
jgi:hypothetical protein